MDTVERNFYKPEAIPEVIQLKIAVVGEKNCGKTTICKTLCEEGKFESEPTIGSDFYSTMVTYGKKLVQVNLWDLSGDKYYLDVRNEFYRESIYDITNKRSFDGLDMWLREVSKFGGESLPVYLCGTKCDLASKRNVTTEEGRDWCNSRNFGGFFEVSPCTSTDSSTRAMIEKIVAKHC